MAVPSSLALPALFALAAVAVAAVAASVEHVPEDVAAVRTVGGSLRDELEPGYHFVPPVLSAVHYVDVGWQTMTVTRDSVTSDGARVVVTATVQYRPLDATAAYHDNHDLSRVLQTALATELRGTDRAALDEERAQFETTVRRTLEYRTDDWDVQVDHVDVETVRDVTGPVSAVR